MKRDNIINTNIDSWKLFFHTTNINSIYNIFSVDFFLKPHFNKYLKEDLIYFYYGKHLGYISNPGFMQIYFPVVIGIKNDRIGSYSYNLFPFDSGGVINRLGYDIKKVQSYDLADIFNIDNFINEKFGTYYEYLNGHHLKYLTKPYKKLYQDIDHAIDINKVDNRIKNIELSCKDNIPISDICYIQFPRQFFNKNGLRNGVEYLFEKSGTKAIYDITKVENKILAILVETLEFNPYLRNIFKENIRINVNNAVKYFAKNESIYFKPEFLVNDIPYLSGFCSVISRIDNNYFELCYSQNYKGYFTLICEDFYQYYKDIGAYKKPRDSFYDVIYRRYIKKLNTERDIIFELDTYENEFWSYKITSNFIIYGTRNYIIKVVLMSIGTIKNKAKTYDEFCEFLLNKNVDTDLVEDIIYDNIDYYLNHNKDDINRIITSLFEILKDFEIKKNQGHQLISDGCIMIYKKLYKIDNKSLNKIKELFLLRGLYDMNLTLNKKYFKESIISLRKSFDTRKNRCRHFLDLYQNYRRI